MGSRVLKFSRAHPDASPGFATVLARLEERLTRANQLAEQQRIGISDVRSATRQKARLRKLIRRSHLVHLAGVAQGVAEMPDLAAKFVLLPMTAPYMAFRAAAGGMAAEAQSQKEILVKNGLAESALGGLTEGLQQFDEAVERFNSARAAHVGASAELDVVARDVVHIVTVMDGLNRARFADDAELLAAWESASNTFGPLHTGEKPTSPEETPPSGRESSTAA
jgi:hypothetical protein